nr:adenylyl-sulfate kinase [Rufibacter tibetensis]
MLDSGLLVICAFISPYEQERQLMKSIIGEDRYLQVYVNTPLEVCENRDPKGLYAKSREGLIPHFTGISAPYETPLTSNVEVKTAEETIEESLHKIIQFIEPLVILPPNKKTTSPTNS